MKQIRFDFGGNRQSTRTQSHTVILRRLVFISENNEPKKFMSTVGPSTLLVSHKKEKYDWSVWASICVLKARILVCTFWLEMLIFYFVLRGFVVYGICANWLKADAAPRNFPHHLGVFSCSRSLVNCPLHTPTTPNFKTVFGDSERSEYELITKANYTQFSIFNYQRWVETFDTSL